MTGGIELPPGVRSCASERPSVESMSPTDSSAQASTQSYRNSLLRDLYTPRSRMPDTGTTSKPFTTRVYIVPHTRRSVGVLVSRDE